MISQLVRSTSFSIFVVSLIVVAGCTAGVADPVPAEQHDGFVLSVGGRGPELELEGAALPLEPEPATEPTPSPVEPDPGVVEPDPILTVSPAERLSLAGGEPGAELGTSLAIEGDTAVAGAPGEQRVYVLSRATGHWSLVEKIDAPDPEAADFGANVAWDGKHLAVGAVKGRAFLYRRDGTTWKLIADAPADVRGSGPTTVALPGAYWAVGSGTDVRLFAIEEDGVEQLGTLRPSAAAAGFGRALASDGDRLLVGAPAETDGGAAYLFARQGTNWKLVARFGAGTGARETGFGEAVAVATDVVMIGAPRAGRTQTGMVRVFTETLGEWKETGALTSSWPKAKDFFGSAIALTADVAVIGVSHDDRRDDDAGAVHVFDRAGLYTWTLGEVLAARDAVAGDLFGTAVATDGRTIAIGAPAVDDGASAPDVGAVYLH